MGSGDLAMERFVTLEPEIRSFALVGQFLQRWALTERELHNCIREALDLSNINTLIVTKNIQLRDKINILNTCVAETAYLPDAEVKAVRLVIEDFSSFSLVRNMMAHDA